MGGIHHVHDMTYNRRKAWKTIRKLSNYPTTYNPPCLVSANQVANQVADQPLAIAMTEVTCHPHQNLLYYPGVMYMLEWKEPNRWNKRLGHMPARIRLKSRKDFLTSVKPSYFPPNAARCNGRGDPCIYYSNRAYGVCCSKIVECHWFRY